MRGNRALGCELRPSSALLSVLFALAVLLGGAAQLMAQTPQIYPGGVVNGASFAPGAPIAPGSIASIFGENLADSSDPATAGGIVASSLPLPTTLGGAMVRVNGIPAPLFYVSRKQINFLMPPELGDAAQGSVSVIVGASLSNPVTVALKGATPGIFEVNLSSAGAPHQGAILIANTPTLAAPRQAVAGSQPAPAGGIVSIFCTGLGPVQDPNDPASQTKTIPRILISSQPATVLWSGLAPGFIGLYQVNARIPATAPSGNTIPVVLTLGDEPNVLRSNPVTMAIESRGEFQVDPAAIDFVAPGGGANPPARTVTVSNKGPAVTTLNPAISVVGACSWLNVSLATLPPLPGSTGNPNPTSSSFEVSARVTDLESGNYPPPGSSCRVTISDANAVNSPFEIAVTLVVPAPEVSVIPPSLSFGWGTTGGNPPDQTITVSNSGGGFLSGSVSFSVTTPAGGNWLSVSPTSFSRLAGASGTATLTVSVDATGLGEGIYTGVIALTPASGTVKTVPVTLSIGRVVIKLDKTALSFEAPLGGGNPADQTVKVSNGGVGSLGVNVVAAVSTPTGGKWLTVSPALLSGLTQGAPAGTLTVSVDVTGLVSGSYTGATITVIDKDNPDNVGKIDVTLKVPDAVIAPDPAKLDFTAPGGGKDPAKQDLKISNAGGGTLKVTATATVNTPPGGKWLSITPTDPLPGIAGSSAKTLSVAVSVADLAKGTYTGTITLSGDSNSQPVTVPVTLKVGPAIISANPSSLTITTAEPQTLTISNAGGGLLTGKAEVKIITPVNGSWLTLSPVSFTDLSKDKAQPVTVTVNLGGLGAGDYTATITLTADNDPDVAPVPVPVKLTVPGPTLKVSPTTINFAPRGGANPDPQTITVSNAGGLIMNVSDVKVTGDASDPSAKWLTFAKALPALAATESGTITLSANAAGLASGTYNAKVTITAPGAKLSPQDVTVTLTILPPILGLSPQSLSFSGVAGGSSAVVIITNAGGGVMSGIITTSGESWLSVPSSFSGVTAAQSQTIMVGVTAGALTSGSARATITFTPNVGSPVTITVTMSAANPNMSVDMNVIPPDVTYIRAYGFLATAQTLQVAAPTALQQTVSVSNSGGGLLAVNAVTSGGAWLSVTPSGLSLPFGKSDKFTVKMDPATAPVLAASAYSGTVSITSGVSVSRSINLKVYNPQPALTGARPAGSLDPTAVVALIGTNPAAAKRLDTVDLILNGKYFLNNVTKIQLPVGLVPVADASYSFTGTSPGPYVITCIANVTNSAKAGALAGEEGGDTIKIKVKIDETAPLGPNNIRLSVPTPAYKIDGTGAPTTIISTPAPLSCDSTGVCSDNYAVVVINNPVPTLTALSVTAGKRLDVGTLLTLTGTNFVKGSCATPAFGCPDGTQFGPGNLPAGFTMGPIFVANPTTATTTILSISDTAVLGANVFKVNNPQLVTPVPCDAAGVCTVTTTPAGGDAPTGQTFTVSNPLPTLSSITGVPKRLDGVTNPDATLVLAGANFVKGNSATGCGTLGSDGSQIINLPATIAVTCLTVNSAAQITATVRVAWDAPLGNNPLNVNNPVAGGGAGTGGTSAAQNFSVINPDPVLSTILPAAGKRLDTNVTIAVTGNNFVIGTGTNPGAGDGTHIDLPATLAPAGFTFTVNSPTSATAVLTSISDTAVLGGNNVTVTNVTATTPTTGAQVFTVTNPSPTFLTLATTTAKRLDTNLTNGALDAFAVTGTNFVRGVGGVGGDGTQVNLPGQFTGSLTVTGPTTATLTITAISDTAALGANNIAVTNIGAVTPTSNALPFTVTNPSPTLLSLATTAGKRLDTNVTNPALNAFAVTGTNFVRGVGADGTQVNLPGQFSGSLTVTGPGTATLTITNISDTAVLGANNITVTNTGAVTPTSGAQSFTVTNPSPTLLTLATTNGKRLETNVTNLALNAFAVTGTNFVTGVGADGTQVNLPGQFTGSLTVTGAGTATLTITGISQTAALGANNITVTNTGAVTPISGAVPFTVSNPTPTITSVNSTLKRLDAVGTVTVNGTGFIGNTLDSPSQLTLPATVTGSIASVTADGATMTINITNVADTAPLAASLTVTNPVGAGAVGTGGAINGNFAITNPSPTLVTLATTSGKRLDTNVTNLALNAFAVTGSNFVTGVGADGTQVNLPGQFTGSLTVTGPTTATLTITGISQTAALGANDIKVTNTGAATPASNALVFTVSNPTPTLVTLATTSGKRLDTNVTNPALNAFAVTGTNFVTGVGADGTQVNLPGQFTGSLTVTGPATATLTITAIGDTAALGANNITVTNPVGAGAGGTGGTSGAQTFTVSNPAPTLVTLATTSANRLDTNGTNAALDAFAVTGTNFVRGVGADGTKVDLPGQFTGSLTVTGPTTATFTITAISDTAALGANNITVTNPLGAGAVGTGGTSGAQTLTVSNPAPTVAGLAPSAGLRLDTNTPMTITGTKFVRGVGGDGTQLTLPAGFAVNVAGLYTVVNSTTATVNIDIAPTAATGANNITLTNPVGGGAPLTGGVSQRAFTVNNPVPTLTNLSVTAGLRLDTGTAITLTGTNFISGVTSIDLPAGFTQNPANNFSVTNSTTATVTVDIGPTAATGANSITVTNAAPGGGTSGAQTFTVSNPAPTLTNLSVTAGNRLDTGTAITLTGTNFISGVTSLNLPGGFSVNAGGPFTVVSSTSATVTIDIAAAAATGANNITVTNAVPGGGPSAAQTFTVSNPAPTLTNLSVTAGNRLDTGTAITLTGTKFITGVTSLNLPANITVNAGGPFTVVSPTSATVTIDIGAVAATGANNITVTNAVPGGGTSAAQTFTVNNPAPTLTSATANNATRGDSTVNIVLAGTKFISGVSSVSFSNAGITVNSTTVDTATQITVNISVAAGATADVGTVSVTNVGPVGGGPVSVAFTVKNPAPTLASATANNATRGDTNVSVVLAGTGFTTGVSSVTFSNAGITVNTTTVDSSTQITVNITVAAGATANVGTVSVTNAGPGGGSASVAFTVNNPAPTLTSLDVTTGKRLDAGKAIILTGTNFISGVTTVTLPPGFTQNSFSVANSTTATVTVDIGGTAALGANNITVTNPVPGGGSATLPGAFTVSNPVPTLTSVSPTGGNRLDTAVLLTIDGTNFVVGNGGGGDGTAITLPAGVTAGGPLTVVNWQRIQVTVNIAGTAALGAKDITVTNPVLGGGSATLPAAFTVSNPLTTISNVTPLSASRAAGGATITIDGSGFVNSGVVDGTAVTMTDVSGTTITVSSLTIVNSGQLTFIANLTGATAAPGGATISVTNTGRAPATALFSVYP